MVEFRCRSQLSAQTRSSRLDMSDRKRKSDAKKLEALELEVKAVRAYTEREVGNLKRRVDRMEKSAHLVVEFSSKIEELYSGAEASREFRKLAQDTAMAILRELNVLTGLPTPIPQVPPETFHAQSDENSKIDLEALISWYEFAPALLSCVRFVLPNRARKTRDPVTQEWTRGKGHFMVRLEFGEGSLCVQKCLQGTLGAYIYQAVKRVREQGESAFNLYLDKIPEEIERKQRRLGMNPQDSGKGRGLTSTKGGRGRGKGKGGRGRGGPEGGR